MLLVKLHLCLFRDSYLIFQLPYGMNTDVFTYIYIITYNHIDSVVLSCAFIPTTVQTNCLATHVLRHAARMNEAICRSPN